MASTGWLVKAGGLLRMKVCVTVVQATGSSSCRVFRQGATAEVSTEVWQRQWRTEDEGAWTQNQPEVNSWVSGNFTFSEPQSRQLGSSDRTWHPVRPLQARASVLSFIKKADDQEHCEARPLPAPASQRSMMQGLGLAADRQLCNRNGHGVLRKASRTRMM